VKQIFTFYCTCVRPQCDFSIHVRDGRYVPQLNWKLGRLACWYMLARGSMPAHQHCGPTRCGLAKFFLMCFRSRSFAFSRLEPIFPYIKIRLSRLNLNFFFDPKMRPNLPLITKCFLAPSQLVQMPQTCPNWVEPELGHSSGARAAGSTRKSWEESVSWGICVCSGWWRVVRSSYGANLRLPGARLATVWGRFLGPWWLIRSSPPAYNSD